MKDRDILVAQIAGNILSGQGWPQYLAPRVIALAAREAVKLARSIIEEVEQAAA